MVKRILWFLFNLTLKHTYQGDQADNTYIKTNILNGIRQWLSIHGGKGQEPGRNIHDWSRHKCTYDHS